MRVLVMGTDDREMATAVAELGAAGHAVATCHEPGAPAFPCNALTDDGRCPLDAGDVDVALLVRHGGADDLAREDGVRCALRRHVPLVIAGDDTDPYRDWCAATTQLGYLTPALEAAREMPLRPHEAAALRSFRAVLAKHDLPAGGTRAEVRRHGADLHATLRIPTEVDKDVADIASVRVVGALRDVDPFARRIDVAVEVG
jgi:hypothetical protein